MTREEQKKLRELKAALPKIIRSEMKKYKLKKRDFMVWFQKKELFFSLMIDVRERDGHCFCASKERIKIGFQRRSNYFSGNGMSMWRMK